MHTRGKVEECRGTEERDDTECVRVCVEHLQICGCWSVVWGWVWMVCCRNSQAVWTSHGHPSWPGEPADRPPQMPGPVSGWSHTPDSAHKYKKKNKTTGQDFKNWMRILTNVLYVWVAAWLFWYMLFYIQLQFLFKVSFLLLRLKFGLGLSQH